MTPIQAKAIPVVLAGRDVMGAAQTGTGKTAAFSLPLLHKMLRHENASMSPARHPVRALVIAPTRELADQVAANIKGYAAQTKLRVAVVYGGIDMKPQTLELKGGVEVLVATPGRLARPHRGQELRAESGRVRGARRSRPHARHRLPAGPAAHPELPAEDPPDPAVLGDLLARDQTPGRELPAGPGPGRGGATERHRLDGRAALLQRRDRRQARRGDEAHQGPRADPGDRVREFQARLCAPGALVRARRPAHQRACTATNPRTNA